MAESARTSASISVSERVQSVVDEVGKIPNLASVVFREVLRTRVPTIGAAVAFFFLMSLVPLLGVASALLSALPIPNLWQQLLTTMALLVPPEAMSLVRSVIASVITPHPARILSIGILTYLWSATGAFSSLIEALNIAYDVQQERPWWRDRLQALLLTSTCGALGLFSLLCLIFGPSVLHLLSYVLPIPYVFSVIWLPLRAVLLFGTFVANAMLLYLLGPNRKVPFRSLLPGASVAVVFWFAGSFGLSEYAEHFSNYSATYGSLGAIVLLMLWLYLTSVVLLVGAELNAELWKRSCARQQVPRPGSATPISAQGQTPDAA